MSSVLENKPAAQDIVSRTGAKHGDGRASDGLEEMAAILSMSHESVLDARVGSRRNRFPRWSTQRPVSSTW